MRNIDTGLASGIMKELTDAIRGLAVGLIESQNTRRELDMARDQITVRSDYNAGRVRWAGGKQIVIRSVVTEGPSTFLGRSIHVSMSFDQIKHLYEFMLEAKKNLDADNARVEEINKRNQGDVE
jgi:hypothetical protein